MNPQRVVALLLAAFVVVSVGYLVATEIGPLKPSSPYGSGVPGASNETPVDPAGGIVPLDRLLDVGEDAEVEAIGQSPSAVEPRSAPVHEMAVRVRDPVVEQPAQESRRGGTAAKAGEEKSVPSETPSPRSPSQAPMVPMADVAPRPERVIRVTYFSTSVRCVACVNLETMTKESLNEAFAGELASGRMEWRMVMVDRPENRHLIGQYGLFTKSVIVSEWVDGREARWKNLDMVWRLLRDAGAFRNYVVTEVREFSEVT